jgi:DNA topoisomerase-2
LNYLDDDGQLVEPDYYVPILPFVLLNGISGIGTGFSCSIPSYHPLEMIRYLRHKMKGETELLQMMEFVPYYEGFIGTVQKISESGTASGSDQPGSEKPLKYLIKGKYEVLGEDLIRIIELPIGTWTMNYVTFLEELTDGGVDKKGKKNIPLLKDFTNMSTEVLVNITVQFPKGKLRELESTKEPYGVNGLEKLLKLTTTVTTSNMHLFDSKFQLHKYKTIPEIIDAFYNVRIQTYEKRKAAMIQKMKEKVKEISNRVRYIQDTLSNKIDLRKMADDAETEQFMSSLKYDQMKDSYDYLIHMPMNSVNKAKVAKLLSEKETLVKELEELERTTLVQMWMRELDIFEKEYQKYKMERERLQVSTVTSVKTVKKVVSVNKKK